MNVNRIQYLINASLYDLASLKALVILFFG